MPVIVPPVFAARAAASRARLALTALLLACGHSDSFITSVSTVGPSGSGPDVQLTFNVDQDYWPAWTEDGNGILYAFVPLDTRITHRCIGLLPPSGGTRIWQLCDERFVRNDSISSYTGFALGSSGKLLYAEASGPLASPQNIPNTGLWLADTSSPFVRTRLLNLPLDVGGFVVNWLTDIAWTGPSTFIALGQQWNTLRVCSVINCPGATQALKDSTFSADGRIVVGTIAGDHATLTAIAGTDSATGYSLVDAGAAVVFIRRDNLRLLKVPVTGGVPTTIARVTPTDSGELLGVSCKAQACVVATSNVVLSYGGDTDEFGRPQTYAHVVGAPQSTGVGGDLRTVSLATGEVAIVRLFAGIPATPHFSPTTNDVVMQVGGIWGHLQTFARGDANSALHLLSGLVP